MCGWCPRGFNACGTNTGTNAGQTSSSYPLADNRDAYLCLGYFDINASLPPADLYSRNFYADTTASRQKNYQNFLRRCEDNSCGPKAQCQGGSDYSTEYLLKNQCDCSQGDRASAATKGFWFERNICAVWKTQAETAGLDADCFKTTENSQCPTSSSKSLGSLQSTQVRGALSYKYRFGANQALMPPAVILFS